MNLDPRLFETATERACREAGVDKATFEATLVLQIPPAAVAAMKADLARAASLLPPGCSAVPALKRKRF